MNCELKNISKKYNADWIFYGVNFTFESNKTYAITGNNGSGKSTLLQIIYSFQTHTKGSIVYQINNTKIEEEELSKYLSFAAPYLELMDEFTLIEMLQFHFSFKPCLPNVSFSKMIEDSGLKGNENKVLKYFSSGMKQRVKLILAFYSHTPLLLIDEPCTNFDEEGIAWYRNLLLEQHHTKTIIISSNQSYEYDIADGVLVLDNFKK